MLLVTVISITCYWRCQCPINDNLKPTAGWLLPSGARTFASANFRVHTKIYSTGNCFWIGRGGHNCILFSFCLNLGLLWEGRRRHLSFCTYWRRPANDAQKWEVSSFALQLGNYERFPRSANKKTIVFGNKRQCLTADSTRKSFFRVCLLAWNWVLG